MAFSSVSIRLCPYVSAEYMHQYLGKALLAKFGKADLDGGSGCSGRGTREAIVIDLCHDDDDDDLRRRPPEPAASRPADVAVGGVVAGRGNSPPPGSGWIKPKKNTLKRQNAFGESPLYGNSDDIARLRNERALAKSASRPRRVWQLRCLKGSGARASASGGAGHSGKGKSKGESAFFGGDEVPEAVTQ
jgi:hypothetical protein